MPASTLRLGNLALLLLFVLFGCGGDREGTSPVAPGSPPAGLALPTHESSALTEYVLAGKDAELISSGAFENGSALVLDGTSGFEYALYRFQPLGEAPDSVSIILEQFVTTGAWIGLANYDEERWEFSGPFTKQKTLSTDDPKYTSPAGNLWVAVLARGESATVNALSVRTISPNNVPPTADVQADVTSGDAPLTVQFDASASDDADGSVIEYAWDFDGNGTYEEFSDGPLVSHDYLTPGIRTVKLRAMDDQLARSTDTVQITVTVLGNSSPVADVTANPDTGDAPLQVDLDASGSSDADGSIVKYEWDFDGDDIYDGYGSLNQATHTYNVPGLYNAGLRVTDNAGAQDTATVQVDVTVAGNLSPLAFIEINNDAGDAPLDVDFSAGSSFDVDGTIVRYDWDFDSNGTWEMYDGPVALIRTYTIPGDYAATLRVTDDDGAQDTNTVPVFVNESPRASFTAIPQEGEPGETVDLDGSGSTDDDGVIDSHEWDLDGNGSFETDTGTDHAQKVLPTTPGHYQVRLRVTDDDGATDIASRILTTKGWSNASPNPDSAGNVGTDTSLAVVNGFPAISYLDVGDTDLKYVRASNADGSTWGTPVTLDTAAGTEGWYTSLAVVNGRPAVSYWDSINLDLKYVPASDSDGSTWGSPQTVHSTGDVGRFSSLEVVNGHPAISYWDNPNGLLKYVRATNADGSAWGTPLTADSGGDVGWYTSLAVVNGYPAISHHDVGQLNLRFVRATNADGSAWGTPQVLDSAGDVGTYTSLKVVNGHPAVSYYANSGADLRYIRASNPDGSAWGGYISPDSAGGVGEHNSLAVVDGFPAISYYDNSDILRYVRASNADGSAWGTPQIADSGGIDGTHTSLAVVNGQAAISYFDDFSNDLKYVKLY